METLRSSLRRPETGHLVHGLRLVGAGFDRATQHLMDKRHGVEEPPWLPVAWLGPRDGRTRSSNIYACPVYRRAVRGAPLAILNLASREEPALWAKRGVALLCEVPV